MDLSFVTIFILMEAEIKPINRALFIQSDAFLLHCVCLYAMTGTEDENAVYNYERY